MNGWQRFVVLLLCCFTVMVLYPDYDTSGWTFAGMTVLMWTGVIIVLSVVSNLLGIYNFKSLNKLVSFVLICAIMYSLLWYFPQEDKVTPVNKIKYGEIPTAADIKKGLARFTFNFDFVRRNAYRKENFINQDLDADKVKKEAEKVLGKKAEEAKDKLDIVVE